MASNGLRAVRANLSPSDFGAAGGDGRQRPGVAALRRLVIQRNRTGTPPFLFESLPGGRTWWAHLEFEPAIIELTIHKKKIEEKLGILGTRITSERY